MEVTKEMHALVRDMTRVIWITSTLSDKELGKEVADKAVDVGLRKLLNLWHPGIKIMFDSNKRELYIPPSTGKNWEDAKEFLLACSALVPLEIEL